MVHYSIVAILLAVVCLTPCSVTCVAAQEDNPKSVFAKDNLVAWCIVPFDAKQRTPKERAEMVVRLGLTKVAYDWRDEHIPTFEDEIQQYQQRGLEYFAFWGWHESIGPLIEKYGVQPQIWMTCPSPEGASQSERVAAAAASLQPLVEETRRLGLKLGLYNHGGWGGEPSNLVEVCQHLHRQGADHVGIVYNFHHGHGHIDDFAESLQLLKPYLLGLNINGMADADQVNEKTLENKILPIGSGKHDLRMLQTIRDSGYAGAIGILDHRSELDAEESLRQNLDGLQLVLRRLGDTAALESFP